MKLLIGDDSVLARKQVKDILRNIIPDAEFIDASNGQEAVETYKSENPDITFLDIVMPVKDGVSSTREIVEYDKDALIIIVSSVGTQTELKAAIDAGAKDFVQKPIKASQLETVVKNHL